MQIAAFEKQKKCVKSCSILLNRQFVGNVIFSSKGSGNIGSQVFKQGLKRFLPNNQHTQRKLLNFENWCSGEASKSAKI